MGKRLLQGAGAGREARCGMLETIDILVGRATPTSEAISWALEETAGD